MLTNEQHNHYEENGFVILPDFFSANEIDSITAIIDGYDERQEQRLRESGQSFNNVAGKINFTSKLNLLDSDVQQFACQKKMADLAMEILGPDVQLYWDQSVYKRPGADQDFPWHQDNGYTPITPEHYLTCWLALEDSTVANGCVWVRPGTHKKGLVEHTKTPIGWQCYFGDDPGTPVELKKGSMVIFHSLLFHRSSPNTTQSTRKGYIMQYAHAEATHARTGNVFHNGPVITKEGEYTYQRE